MKLKERYRRLTLWNRLAAWGAVASIGGAVLTLIALLLSFASKSETTEDPRKTAAPAPVENVASTQETTQQELSGVDVLNKDDEVNSPGGSRSRSQPTTESPERDSRPSSGDHAALWRPPIADRQVERHYQGTITYLTPVETPKQEKFLGIRVGRRVTTPHRLPVLDYGQDIELPLDQVSRLEVLNPIPHNQVVDWPGYLQTEEIPQIEIRIFNRAGGSSYYNMYATGWFYYLAADGSERGLHPCRVQSFELTSWDD
jgi:hypothetical protein